MNPLEGFTALPRKDSYFYEKGRLPTPLLSDVSIEMPAGFLVFPAGVVFLHHFCYDIFMNAYLLHVPPLAAHENEILPLLTPARREKALACPLEEDRLLSLGTGLLLYHVLGVKADEDLLFNEYGAPRLREGSPCFSLSHSGEYALLAVSSLPVGADIEKIHPVRKGLFARMAAKGEQEEHMDFFTLFTRKEAMMKASGRGFSLSPKGFSVAEPLFYEGARYYFHTFYREEYVLSFAAQEKQPPVVKELFLKDILF